MAFISIKLGTGSSSIQAAVDAAARLTPRLSVCAAPPTHASTRKQQYISNPCRQRSSPGQALQSASASASQAELPPPSPRAADPLPHSTDTNALPGPQQHQTEATAQQLPQPQSLQPLGPLPPDLLLSNIRVVLVSPKHDSNIGAVARACANFECVQLAIVAPRCSADPDGEARKVACGDAVLSRMRVYGTLSEALCDASSSIGFTRRAGATRHVHPSLGQLMAEFPWVLAEAAVGTVGTVGAAATHMGQQQGGVGTVDSAGGQEQQQQGGKEGQEGQEPEGGAGCGGWGGGQQVTALVFGREESGLTEAELRLCSHACAIPTGRLQPSMNLSHAVAVVLAELYGRRSGALVLQPPAPPVDAAVPVPGLPTRSPLEPHLQRHSTPGALRPGGGDGDGGEEAAAAAAQLRGGVQAGELGTAFFGGGTRALGFNPWQEPPPPPQQQQQQEPAAPDSSSGQQLPYPQQAYPQLQQGPAQQPAASQREVDLLVAKVAAVAAAVGMRAEEGTGGGSKGNHGRRRLPVGHVRAVVGRARLTAGESRSLHGLASAVLQRVDPEHPLEAQKRERKQRQQRQQQQQQRQQGEHAHGMQGQQEKELVQGQ